MKPFKLFLFFTCGIVLNAQVIDFEDENFKTTLLAITAEHELAKDLEGNFTAIDTNEDGEIQIDEAESISYLRLMAFEAPDLLDVTHVGISKEIGFFINLTEVFIGETDLSENVNLRRVTYEVYEGSVNCILPESNTLEFIEIRSIYANISNIQNLSSHTELQELKIIPQTPISFEGELDLTANTNLRRLSLENVYFTTPVELDFSANTKLEFLKFGCASPSCLEQEEVESINLTKNLELKELIIHSSGLKHIDLYNNTKLEKLEYHGMGNNEFIGGSAGQLSLNLVNNTKLKSLKLTGYVGPGFQSSFYHTIGSVDISNCTELETFVMSDRFSTEYLNISSGHIIENLDISSRSYPKSICIDEENINKALDQKIFNFL